MSGRLRRWWKHDGGKAHTVLMATLALLLWAPVATVAAVLDADEGPPGITMVAEFVLTQELADQASSIELAALTSPQASDKDLLTLSVVQEPTFFGFSSWWLTLGGELLPESAQRPGADRRLHQFLPQYDHTYRAHVAYDAASGTLSLLFVDLTDQVVLYMLQTVVNPTAPPLTERNTAYLAQVEPIFIPVGTAWRVLAGFGDALAPANVLSLQETAVLELVLQSPRPAESFRLIARNGEERIELAQASLASGKYNIPLDVRRLTPGRWQIGLDLTPNGHVWSSGLTYAVQVIAGRVSAQVTKLERRQGQVQGVITVAGDGPVGDVHLQLFADIYRMTGGEWQLLEERALLYETVVDVNDEPLELPFSLGERLDKDATHKLTVSFTLIDSPDTVLAALKAELQLHAGETGFMGGIPQIDIAQDKSRQTVIDRIPGQYLGHPDSVLMADNRTIFIVYPLGHGGPTVLRRSTDGGVTWSERLPVPENWGRTANVPTIFRLTDPQGVERLIVFQNLTRPGEEVSRDNAEDVLSISISEDNGQTWTPFQQTGLHSPVAPNTVIPISGGRYLTVFQLGSRVQMAISEDGGLTWQNQRAIASHPDAALVEPAAIQSPDGKEIAVLIRENSRKYNSMLIVSKDEGQTWSAPVELPATLTGDRHKPVYAPDGRLVITFRDVHADSPSYGDFVAWVGTYDDLVNLRPGQYRVKLLENLRQVHDTGYAGLELLPDGTFVSTTYVPLYQGERPSVVSLRFKLEELDALVAEQYGDY